MFPLATAIVRINRRLNFSHVILIFVINAWRSKPVGVGIRPNAGCPSTEHRIAVRSSLKGLLSKTVTVRHFVEDMNACDFVMDAANRHCQSHRKRLRCPVCNAQSKCRFATEVRRPLTAAQRAGAAAQSRPGQSLHGPVPVPRRTGHLAALPPFDLTGTQRSLPRYNGHSCASGISIVPSRY